MFNPGFIQALRKLTQPYDDEEDFFEGADGSLRPSVRQESAQAEPEDSFEEEFSADAGQASRKGAKAAGEGAGFFGSRGVKKPAKPKAPHRERLVNFGGSETQVILFSPKSFDEAGELMNHLLQGIGYAGEKVQQAAGGLRGQTLQSHDH